MKTRFLKGFRAYVILTPLLVLALVLGGCSDTENGENGVDDGLNGATISSTQ